MHSLVELLAYTVAAFAFTALGIFVELQGVVRVAAGEPSAGAWLAAVGLLLLYAGVYLLGYERVATRLREPIE